MKQKGALQIRLAIVQERKMASRKIRSSIRWKHRDAQVTRTFFRAVRECGSLARINALHGQARKRLINRDSIKARTLSYYQELHATPSPMARHQVAEDALLGLSLASFSSKFPLATLKELGKFPEEPVHEEKVTFLSSQYIFDVVLVQNKTVAWSHKLDQKLIMLKFDFWKAFDTMSWNFMFNVMTRMNIPTTLVKMV